MRMNALYVLCTLLAITGCRSTSHLPAVTDFDLTRYEGIWYEAVRYPHRFEKDLVSVSANYTLQKDGTVSVLNRGYHAGKGQWKEIEGVAKFRGDSDVGWLKVSFFKPFYASYKIIYLDEAYTQAIVTGPSYGYLWILVRDSKISETKLQALIDRAVSFGFEEDKMIRVSHHTP